MTELKIQNTLPSLSKTEIAEFEDSVDFVLPSSYREFLHHYNGGRPEPNMFPIQDFYADTHGLLDRFLSIAEGNVLDLTRHILVFHERIPPELLPIARDPGGNLICLAVKGSNYGKIYYWDHETEVDDGEQPTYDNVYFIANSFDDLLNSLTPSP